jgi:hypothetical protein
MSEPALTILDALDDPNLFGAAFPGESWRPWRGFLGSLFGLQLLPDSSQSLARACTGRSDAVVPERPFREAWIAAGRRSGKSRILAAIAVFAACFIDWRPRLAVGETGTVMLLATDRSQASVLLGYCRGLIVGTPLLRNLLTGESAERLELGTQRVAIEVHTSSYKAVRGRTLVAALADEVAFWRDDTSSNPAQEAVRALRPALATLAPHSLLIGASSPYSRSGLLWDQYRRHHGREGSQVLVWQSASRTMNPSLSAKLVADALAEDPEAGGAEYLAEFRRDVASFVAPEAVTAAVIPARQRLPPAHGVIYYSFIDPSGGSADSFTLGIAHTENDRIVLDLAHEVRPPFDPLAVTEQFAATLRLYGLHHAGSDRYGGAWVTQAFARHGITIQHAEKPKSQLYLEMLPLLNAGKVELLDNPRLLGQLLGLERHTARSGRDQIDHAPNARDDLINTACGAIVLAATRTAPIDFFQHLILGAPLGMAGTTWPGLIENPHPEPTGGIRGERLSVRHYRSAFDPAEPEPWKTDL